MSYNLKPPYGGYGCETIPHEWFACNEHTYLSQALQNNPRVKTNYSQVKANCSRVLVNTCREIFDYSRATLKLELSGTVPSSIRAFLFPWQPNMSAILLNRWQFNVTKSTLKIVQRCFSKSFSSPEWLPVRWLAVLIHRSGWDKVRFLPSSCYPRPGRTDALDKRSAMPCLTEDYIQWWLNRRQAGLCFCLWRTFY